MEERVREVPSGLTLRCLGSKRFLKRLMGGTTNRWLSLRLATVPSFLRQYEDGFYEEDSDGTGGQGSSLASQPPLRAQAPQNLTMRELCRRVLRVLRHPSMSLWRDW